MADPLPRITTIIATGAVAERARLLKRAIDSVRAAARAATRIVIVVNGTRYDQRLLEWLQAQPDVRLERLERASLPLALLHGREHVETEFFATLDDDDEYLPNALVRRADALDASGADVVITNGYRHACGRDRMFHDAIESVPASPLAKLFEHNWLASCNALYRSSSIGREYFANYHPFLEWTWMAFQLATSDVRIVALAEATFRNYDTPNSLSKSDAYFDADLALYRRMLARNTPPEITRLIQRRVAAALHNRSLRELARGNRAKAITFHLRSLFRPGGLQYLAYSRRLLPGWPSR